MKKISRILIGSILVTSFIFSGLVVVARPVAAQNNAAIYEGVSYTGGNCNDNAEVEVNSIIKTVVDILSLVVGVIAVIMIIIGGLRYITSGGDSNNTSAAKNTILYAIIGLVIVAMAQVIVRFVLTQF